MKQKTLSWLLTVTFFIMCITWEGKKLYPSVFASCYIQWSSSVLSAILLSIGMYFSMQAVFAQPEDRKKAGCTCLGFVSLFTLITGFYGVATPMLIHTSNSVASLSSNNTVPKLVQKLYAPESAGNRPAIARAIYMLCGVTVPYQAENGSFIVYKPTSKDNESWTEIQKVQIQAKQFKEHLDWQIKQLAYLTSLYIGCFSMSFLIGILTLIYKKRDSETTHQTG